MRSSLLTCALAASSICANAISLLERRDGVLPRVVQHTIRRREIADPLAHDRRRHLRQRASDTVSVKLTNEETLYFIDVSLGTPAQDLKLHIDTGSSDLWVNVDNSQTCALASNPCASAGTYSANDSSTYQYVNSDFNISYVDGTGAQGDYAADTLTFSGVTLDNQIFGIGYQSSSLQGVLGIGYPSNEVAVSYGFQPYANVPANLVKNGYIRSNAYSLYLDDLDASTGSILFGGVDTSKYTGELQTLPILKTAGQFYAYFTIALTDIGSDGNTGSIASKLNLPALLDSGSSLMYLPNDVANKIFKELGASYSAQEGAAIIDCDMANSDKTIDFTFTSPTIKVPLNELILQAGQNLCFLGIGLSGGSTPVLGDTFIRSAYIVYDIDNNEIALAQSNFDSSSSNIQEIGGKSIPSATDVQNPVTSVAQVSEGAINVGFSSASDVPNAAPTAPVGYNVALLGAAGAAMLAL